MEYVIVKFHQDRVVLIDDQENGRTNRSLRVGAGTHTFSLEGDKDFSPEEITCVVDNTSILEPLEVEFGGSDA